MLLRINYVLRPKHRQIQILLRILIMKIFLGNPRQLRHHRLLISCHEILSEILNILIHILLLLLHLPYLLLLINASPEHLCRFVFQIVCYWIIYVVLSWLRYQVIGHLLHSFILVIFAVQLFVELAFEV